MGFKTALDEVFDFAGKNHFSEFQLILSQLDALLDLFFKKNLNTLGLL